MCCWLSERVRFGKVPEVQGSRRALPAFPPDAVKHLEASVIALRSHRHQLLNAIRLSILFRQSNLWHLVCNWSGLFCLLNLAVRFVVFEVEGGVLRVDSDVLLANGLEQFGHVDRDELLDLVLSYFNDFFGF